MFDDIVKSTRQAVSGTNYYITFQAKDATHPSNSPSITFQAKVWKRIPSYGPPVVTCVPWSLPKAYTMVIIFAPMLGMLT